MRHAERAFVDSAFERILGRVPTAAERAECLSGLARLASAFASEAAETATRRRSRARRRWFTCCSTTTTSSRSDEPSRRPR